MGISTMRMPRIMLLVAIVFSALLFSTGGLHAQC
jgi:hypothetical protein